MTFGPGGELVKYLHKVGSFDIPCCRFYTGELILGLAHLHKLRIVHRDLKPENILLDHRGHILITDFGSSKLMAENPEEPPPREFCFNFFLILKFFELNSKIHYITLHDFKIEFIFILSS